MTLGAANGIPPKATKPSEWVEIVQGKVMGNAKVKQRGQSCSSRAFIDGNWPDKWGTGGAKDITDLRVSQNNEEGEPLEDTSMLNGGNFRPPLIGMTDKQIVVRNAHGNYVTLHNVLREPHNHLRNAKQGCWKVKDANPVSEPVGVAWNVLIVPCPPDQDFVDIKLQTRYYQATSEKNPNKVWCVNYGSGPMIAAGSVPGGYQCHMNRNETDTPCWVRVEVSSIQAADRPGELSEMSYANRQAAIREKLSKGGDIITLIQVPLMPDDSQPMQSSYEDPYAVDPESDQPVYRSLDAFTVDLKSGAEINMDDAHTNLPHVKNPLHYVRPGHVRGPGLVRIDMIKVIAVKGDITDRIISEASDWLDQRNAGQLMPLEEVVAVQIEHQSLFPCSEKYKEHLKSCDKRAGSSDESQTKSLQLETELKSELKPMEE